MGVSGGKGRKAVIKPGRVLAHRELIEPKVSASIVGRRGVSIMWLTPLEAKLFGTELLSASERCIKK